MLCAFDFDGTLGDSRQINYQTAKFYSQQKGLKVPSQLDVDSVFGNPNPPFVFDGWGSRDEYLRHLDAIYVMTDHMICQRPEIMPLYDGIQDLLRDLRQDHFTMTVVTSRALKPILALLEYHNIACYFSTIRTHQDIQDRGHRGKPYPDKLNCVLKELNYNPQKAVMIGDTIMDIKMAKSAGVSAIGVTWGFHKEKDLLDHGADRIVSSPQVLTQVIRDLFQEV